MYIKDEYIIKQLVFHIQKMMEEEYSLLVVSQTGSTVDLLIIAIIIIIIVFYTNDCICCTVLYAGLCYISISSAVLCVCIAIMQ